MIKTNEMGCNSWWSEALITPLITIVSVTAWLELLVFSFVVDVKHLLYWFLKIRVINIRKQFRAERLPPINICSFYQQTLI